MAKKKLRPMSQIMFDLEDVLDEMTDPKGHDMQWGEVRALVMKWLEVHAPHAQERYNDGSRPIDVYGHKTHIRSLIKKLRK